MFKIKAGRLKVLQEHEALDNTKGKVANFNALSTNIMRC